MAMITSDAATLAAVALAEVKAHLNITLAEQDAMLMGELRNALALCEQFTGQSLLQRSHREILPVSRSWQALGTGPILAISDVSGISADGNRIALAADAYAIDIAADGYGRVRVTRPGSSSRIAVDFVAGMAAHWGDLPEPLRQGIVRLAAHAHMTRDTGNAAPPALIGALWRPWRRVRL